MAPKMMGTMAVCAKLVTLLMFFALIQRCQRSLYAKLNYDTDESIRTLSEGAFGNYLCHFAITVKNFL